MLGAGGLSFFLSSSQVGNCATGISSSADFHRRSSHSHVYIKDTSIATRRFTLKYIDTHSKTQNTFNFVASLILTRRLHSIPSSLERFGGKSPERQNSLYSVIVWHFERSYIFINGFLLWTGRGINMVVHNFCSFQNWQRALYNNFDLKVGYQSILILTMH